MHCQPDDRRINPLFLYIVARIGGPGASHWDSGHLYRRHKVPAIQAVYPKSWYPTLVKVSPSTSLTLETDSREPGSVYYEGSDAAELTEVTRVIIQQTLGRGFSFKPKEDSPNRWEGDTKQATVHGQRHTIVQQVCAGI